MSNNSKIQTLNDYIRYGKTSNYTIPNSSSLMTVDNITIMESLVYDKYKKLMFGMSHQRVLTDEEMNKYKYRPELLSYDIYSTPNLSHLLLYLNKCSEEEFNMKIVRIISIENLNQIFSLIMSHESDNIGKNKIYVG
jgi:hypothetical protein